jgi:hypothetical protein
MKVLHRVKGKRNGKRRKKTKQLLDDIKGKRCYRKLKEEALDRNLWTTRLGRNYGTCRKKDYEMNALAKDVAYI